MKRKQRLEELRIHYESGEEGGKSRNEQEEEKTNILDAANEDNNVFVETRPGIDSEEEEKLEEEEHA